MRILAAVILLTSLIGCATGGFNEEITAPAAPVAAPNPDDARANAEKTETARMLFEQGLKRMKENPRVSLEIFAEVERLAPEIWTANYNLALVYMKLREFKNAERELIKSLNKKAPPTIIYNTLGMAYMYIDNDKALEAFEKSLAFEKTVIALINLADLYQATGKTKLLLRTLHELEIMAPTDKTAYYDMGLIWYRMEKYKNAEEAFEKALNDGKGDTRVLYLKAQALLGQGKYDAALQVFQDMAAMNIIDPAPYREMGIIYEIYLGDMEMALESYQSYVNKGGEKAKEVSGWIDIVNNRLSKEKGQSGG